MIFSIDQRASDSPFVERVWRARCERAGAFTSIAASCWELVVTRYHGRTTLTMRGPETRATPMYCSVQAEWVGIYFTPGSFLPRLPAGALVNGAVDLPAASRDRFWLLGATWPYPDYDTAETFVDQLARAGLLVHDPLIDAVLHNHAQRVTPRTIQRHFVRATGVTHGTLRQIERARYATLLLQQGLPILDTTAQAGYADQAHLTRSLKQFIGKTPRQIATQCEPRQLSLLFKTAPLL